VAGEPSKEGDQLEKEQKEGEEAKEEGDENLKPAAATDEEEIVHDIVLANLPYEAIISSFYKSMTREEQFQKYGTYQFKTQKLL